MKQIHENRIQTILVVDDNPLNIKAIAVTLRSRNYKLVTATNGKEAIDIVGKTRPDMVLLDVMMPDMDGYETCRIIKSKRENDNIPILFLTALTEKENIVKGFDAGGVDYIIKPFNKNELFSRVKTHLELKNIRDELEKSTKHLSDLNALKDKMFSVIGHDLRSPLGSVKMTLEFLADSADDYSGDEMKSTLDTMVQATDELFYLLENLLSWAKSQSGNLSISPEKIDLNELVHSVYLLNKGNINTKQMHYEADVPDELDIFADLSTIKIVFRNLLSNAIKFTHENGVINISANEINDKVQIKVKDSGVGIPEKHIPKLFDSKQQYKTYGTNSESGSGLGLTLCYDFVEKNNGQIEVESEVDKGSTFIVTLPKAN